MHELATNAVKYGALSVPDGRISIDGRIEQASGEEAFLFLWKETGGPPVTTPLRTGFGTALLLQGTGQFSHLVALRFDPEGLSYELRLRLSAIEVSASGERDRLVGVRMSQLSS